MQNTNPTQNTGTNWSRHADTFQIASADSPKNIDVSKLEFGVAANVLVAWPAVLEQVEQHRNRIGKALFVLDFGCGSGGFTAQCDDSDNYVSAMDSSKSMIEKARANHIFTHFMLGAEADLRLHCKQDVVTATLVANYLDSIETFVARVSNLLVSGGIVTFADLNPAYVHECLQRKIIYSDPVPVENPKYATLNFYSGPQRITLYSAADYDEIFAQQGLTRTHYSTPLLTPDFFTIFSGKMPEKYPAELPRYGIHTFQKA